MKCTELKISGVFLIEPRVFKDDRGAFYEWYNEAVFKRHGISAKFVQDNQSVSTRGTLRGLHFQIPPKAQAKLVRVVHGEVFDVVVDLRKSSKTFGKHLVLTLRAEDRKVLFIPEGLAHGFLSLRNGTEFQYKVSELYSPAHERGIRFDDPEIGIPWPRLGVPYRLSERDKNFPLLKKFINFQ